MCIVMFCSVFYRFYNPEPVSHQFSCLHTTLSDLRTCTGEFANVCALPVSARRSGKSVPEDLFAALVGGSASAGAFSAASTAPSGCSEISGSSEPESECCAFEQVLSTKTDLSSGDRRPTTDEAASGMFCCERLLSGKEDTKQSNLGIQKYLVRCKQEQQIDALGSFTLAG